MKLTAQSHSSSTAQLAFLRRLTADNLPPIMSKLRRKCAQNIQKASGAQFGHYARKIGVVLSSDLHNRHFNSCRIEEDRESNMETNYISKQQKAFKERTGCQGQERKGRFVKAVVSENKRFLFTPPNGCEHFLNIACGGCIRKVKGLAVIVMAKPSHLIYDL